MTAAAVCSPVAPAPALVAAPMPGLLREVSDSCLQYWGGMGYMWESKIARMYRDSRLASIGGGADEVMLSIICKLDGTLPGKP